ncbi:MAG: AMP-binding protein [Syntrophomonadaceae bacterium]|jgi:acyl-CoA synthetase (AMP-forming)/AMP-acid ligase II|nr:AMP-binding protein [Syntrophomonadaceae bacterium]
MQKEEILNYHLKKVQDLRLPHQYSTGLALENQAKERPQHPAVIFSGQEHTYDDFNRRANRYANYFSEQGFVKGDVVALMMPNCPEFLFILLGLSKIGVAVALINFELKGAVLAQGINIVEAKAIIIGHKFTEFYDSITGIVRLHAPSRVFLVSDDKPRDTAYKKEWLNPLVAEASDQNPSSTKDINSEDVLAYIYTSGNYGPRKAVPIQHKRTLLVGHQSCLFCHMNADRIQYTCLPLYLNAGLNVCLASMIASGSTMVLKEKFSVEQFWEDVNRYKADYFVGVGELYRYLFSKPPSTHDKDNSLEVAICNGITKELQEPFRERFGVEHIIEIYGTAENVGFFINYLEHPGICGTLNLGGIRQGEVVRCDLDSGNVFRNEEGRVIPCKVGENGVLLCAINEYNTFTGYVGDPEASQLKLVNNALVQGDSHLNTYDLVRLHEDDEISFIDRLGQAYRWKGKTVSIQLVEDVLSRFMGPIEDVCVYSVKIPGHEGRCGMAAIKLLENEKLNWGNFVDYINRKIPGHAQPVFIRIVEKLPREKILLDMLSTYKKDSYSPSIINDKIYYYNTEESKYKLLTQEIYEDIMKQGYIEKENNDLKGGI